MTTLDVIIPSYNRAGLLERAIESVLAARVPPGLRRRVLPVDNNSTDRTAEVLAAWAARAPGEVIPLRETDQQGRSAALNAGIRASEAELLGFIDDDERIDPGWLEAAVEALADPDLGYVGGPVLGDWQQPPPAWLPEDKPAILGVIDPGPLPLEFNEEYPGILMGGNSVIRRKVFDQVGLYSTELGRTDKGLRSGEDAHLYERLLRAGIRGRYLPALRLYHFIPAERLTRKYFRSWCFWHGISAGEWSRTRNEPVPHLLGIPRYHLGRAWRGLLRQFRPGPARFAAELELWSVAGILYGRHFTRRKGPAS